MLQYLVSNELFRARAYICQPSLDHIQRKPVQKRYKSNVSLSHDTKEFLKLPAYNWPRKVTNGFQPWNRKSISILHYVMA